MKHLQINLFTMKHNFECRALDQQLIYVHSLCLKCFLSLLVSYAIL